MFDFAGRSRLWESVMATVCETRGVLNPPTKYHSSKENLLLTVHGHIQAAGTSVSVHSPWRIICSYRDPPLTDTSSCNISVTLNGIADQYRKTIQLNETHHTGQVNKHFFQRYTIYLVKFIDCLYHGILTIAQNSCLLSKNQINRRHIKKCVRLYIIYRCIVM